MHASVRCHEVGHVQQPVRAEQMGEAAAAVQRMGREGDEESHAGTLVLQAAAAGAPLRFLYPRSWLQSFEPPIFLRFLVVGGF